MAVNKRKVLDAARKFAQKGAKQKALKEYSTLLKLDPRDAKLHLEIGDAHRRWGEIDEAINQYLRVAEQYKEDGFDARAVAVFKQVLNLDPKRYPAYVSLADLYQRIGLDSEATAALQTAADGYHKEGKKREALDLLRKMAALDPTNTTNRMKVAELLRQEDMQADAVAEYEEVAAELSRQGAHDSICSIYERILDMEPGRVDIIVGLTRTLMDLNRCDRAEAFAKRAVDAEPDQPTHYELLMDVYRELGRQDEATQLTRKLAKVYRDRGDDENARELLQRLPTDEAAGDALDAGADSDADGADELLIDDDLIEDNDFLDLGTEGSERGADAPEDDAELELDAPVPTAEPDEPEPEGDPDQLLAEASVYLRYGKTEKAIASLNAVLRQDPGSRTALEKLGDAHSEAGDVAQAADAWSEAADLAQQAGDDSGLGVLVERIRAIDPDAAARFEAAADSDDLLDSDPDLDIELNIEDEADVDIPDEVDIDLDGGLELDIDDDVASEVQGEGPELEYELEGEDGLAEAEEKADFDIDVDMAADGLDTPPSDESEEEDDGFELDVDLDEGESGLDEPTEPDATLDVGVDLDMDLDEPADEIDASADLDFDLDETEDLSGAAVADDVAPAEADTQNSASLSLSASAAGRVAEELEEAEFYFQQSLFDEAEAIYQRVLSAAPHHPSAQLRLGEIAAARGEDPSAAGGLETAVDSQTQSEPASLDLDLDDDATPADLAVDGPPLEDEFPDAVAAMTDETDEIAEPDHTPMPAAEITVPDTSELGGASDDEDSFDLGAALRDSFDDEEEEAPAPAEPEGASTASDGFESIFADFKRGVSQTLSEGDYQTRYDLGLAYREMELHDDAIEEFRRCLESPSLRFQSLHMMGICALSLGRGDDAVNHLEQALAMPDAPPGAVPGVQFDLGRVYESLSDLARARASYEAVSAADPSFPGVNERLQSLGEAPETEEGLESFDDIFEETEEPEPPSEAFESFDDVITEVEAVAEAEEVDEIESEAVLEPEAVVEDEAGGDAASTGSGKPKGGRKKKISFV